MDDYLSHGRDQARRKTQSQFRLILGATLGAFLLGAGAVGYLAWNGTFDRFLPSRAGAEDPVVETTVVAPEEATEPDEDETTTTKAQVQQAAQAQQAVERVAEQQGGLEQRVVAMEQRLSQLDLQAQAAAGNTARAEGLLIAFATRRAIERGAALGYLEDQLQLRFGDARPNAVEAVLAAANDPVTLDQLLARLEGLAPRLTQNPQSEGITDWLGRELSALFVVRREDSPSPQPARRIERARLFLETGRPEAAIAEVRNLPNAAEATDWIEDAERYARAQRALDLLETTAVLEPRELRDGTGNRVEQPSPANDSAGN